MNYRVETMDSFQITGVSKTYSTMTEAQNEISAFWAEVNQSGKSDELINIKNNTLPGMLGLCFPDEDGGMEYVIGVTGDDSDSFKTFTVTGGRYLVFDAVGPVPSELQRVTNEIFQNVMPSSEYELRDAPEFEVYHPGDVTADDYTVEIWVPVK